MSRTVRPPRRLQPALWVLAINCLITSPIALAGEPNVRPNILVLLSDDQGYHDVGFHGCRDIPTPHLDRLAAAGVRCTNGYVTNPVCSPSRAGLLSGRSPQRFGHEVNPVYDPHDHREGLPVTETLFPKRLREAGYATGWIGKWHLGAAPEFHPLKRGFTEGFGFIGGGHRYVDWPVDPVRENLLPIERNGQPVEESRHLTVAFGQAGAEFVRRHRERPWFLYLAFNAPHYPNEPTAERWDRFAAIENPQRRAYAAQVSLLDDAVGAVLDALHATGQEQRTLVFFLTDNGGPLTKGAPNGSRNTPLRGEKGDLWEGGIRVPFVVSWPGTLAAGTTYGYPISAVDIMATSLAAAGLPMPTDRKYDSVNLLPYLRGEAEGLPHHRLFWRSPNGVWAVREGQWKLVRFQGQPDELFNIAQDIGEKKNIAADHPVIAERLATAIDDWNSELLPPAFARIRQPRR